MAQNSSSLISLPSLTFAANITNAVLESMSYFSVSNSTTCFRAALQIADDYSLINKTDKRMGSAFNITKMVSTSVANFSLNCPVSLQNYLTQEMAHFEQFENSTVG